MCLKRKRDSLGLSASLPRKRVVSASWDSIYTTLVKLLNKYRQVISKVDAHNQDRSRKIAPTKEVIEAENILVGLKRKIVSDLKRDFYTSHRSDSSSVCNICRAPTSYGSVICNFKGGCSNRCHALCLSLSDSSIDEWQCTKHSLFKKCLDHLASKFVSETDWETISDVFNGVVGDEEDDEDDDDDDDDDEYIDDEGDEEEDEEEEEEGGREIRKSCRDSAVITRQRLGIVVIGSLVMRLVQGSLISGHITERVSEDSSGDSIWRTTYDDGMEHNLTVSLLCTFFYFHVFQLYINFHILIIYMYI